MLPSVRFSSASLPSRVGPPSTVSKECQTLPFYFSSIGTDPIRAPEKATQTDSQQLLKTAEDKIQIREELVHLIMEELERARKEEDLLDAYERKLAFEEEEKEGRRVYLRHISQLEVPEMDDHFDHSSVVLSSVHCGPGNRISLLFAFPQHDIWCSGHLGARILIVRIRRGQRSRIISVPLSTCPSTVEFARFGELAIVGTHSGALLLLSSESGDLLWSSESAPALTHCFTVTQLRCSENGNGREEQRELISLSLDGTVRKSRLETNNRLELLQSVNFTLADLPRELRKGATDENTKLGLIGCELAEEGILLVATDTGIMLNVDMNGLVLLNTFVIGDSPGGVDQFALLRSDPTDSVHRHFLSQLLWRTADGNIRCCPFRQHKAVTKETKVFPLAHPRENFHICSKHGILLITGESEKGRRELIAWEIWKGEKITLFMDGGAEAATEETEGIGGRGDTVAVVTRDQGGRKRTLTLYELALADDRGQPK